MSSKFGTYAQVLPSMFRRSRSKPPFIIAAASERRIQMYGERNAAYSGTVDLGLGWTRASTKTRVIASRRLSRSRMRISRLNVARASRSPARYFTSVISVGS